MNEQDKAYAREALEKKLLTIEQVEAVRAEVDRSGRAFRDVAAERYAKPKNPPPASPRPKTKMPPVYLGLLAASFVIFAGLLIASVVKLRERSAKDDDLAIETEKAHTEADRRAGEASRGYKRAVISTNEAEARKELAKAREAMGRVDALLKTSGPPDQLILALNQAFVGYNMYLKEIPDDAPVRIERARTHELRKNYDLAIADLERAIQIDPTLSLTLKDRIAQLKLFVARKPQ